jgi:hypothetical protein
LQRFDCRIEKQHFIMKLKSHQKGMKTEHDPSWTLKNCHFFTCVPASRTCLEQHKAPANRAVREASTGWLALFATRHSRTLAVLEHSEERKGGISEQTSFDSTIRHCCAQSAPCKTRGSEVKRHPKQQQESAAARISSSKQQQQQQQQRNLEAKQAIATGIAM